MSWLIWLSLRRIASWPTGPIRRGRHQLDPLWLPHRGIAWCKVLLPRLFREPLSQGVGLSGHHSSQELFVLLFLSRMAQGLTFSSSPLVLATQIVASFVAAPITLPVNAPRPGRRVKGKAQAKTTRTRARGKLFKSDKGELTSLPSLSSRKVHRS